MERGENTEREGESTVREGETTEIKNAERDIEYTQREGENTEIENVEREGENREGEGVGEVGEGIRSERDKWGNRTEEWLCDAAIRGDVESLNEIITIDKYILDKVLAGAFKGKNPLHVAVSIGNKEFVEKLLEKKEDLVKVLDTELGSALHIASSQGYLEIVKLLLKVSPGMCLSRDQEGNNPLHIAAMQGKVEVLEVLLQTSPHAARVKVDRGDSILHLCVNYNQLDSLKLLLEMVRDKEFVNSTDTNGNNILHLAVFGKRFEIIKYVLGNSKIDVNARNGSEWTAMDIIYRAKMRNDGKGEYDSIEEVLRKKRAGRRKELFFPFEASWQIKKKETMMIVSTLMATIAFQVGVNPPGSGWLDDAPDHVAGTAITAYNYPNAYRYFMYFNTIGFLFSLTRILNLIVALPAKHKFMKIMNIQSMISWMTILTAAFTYTFSINVIAPKVNYEKSVSHAILVTVSVWAAVISYVRLVPYKVHYKVSMTIAFVVGFIYGILNWLVVGLVGLVVFVAGLVTCVVVIALSCIHCIAFCICPCLIPIPKQKSRSRRKKAKKTTVHG